MKELDELTVAQLDASLTSLRPFALHTPPRQGWAKTIREALGMSLRQLAERIGLSKTSVTSIETSESNGTVQLDSLKKIADGLECDVVYVLLPRVSLHETIRKQAYKKARTLVNQVSDSMDLEAQGINDHEKARQIQELVDDMMRRRGRDFWND